MGRKSCSVASSSAADDPDPFSPSTDEFPAHSGRCDTGRVRMGRQVGFHELVVVLVRPFNQFSLGKFERVGPGRLVDSRQLLAELFQFAGDFGGGQHPVYYVFRNGRAGHTLEPGHFVLSERQPPGGPDGPHPQGSIRSRTRQQDGNGPGTLPFSQRHKEPVNRRISGHCPGLLARH